MRKLSLLVAVCFAVGGCSAGADKAAAEAEVTRFRRLMDNGQYQQIYRTSGVEFRRAGSEASAVRFLQTVHDRLGRVRSSSQTGWHFNVTPAASVTTLTYATEFERGRGIETFNFRSDNGRPSLIGYNMNSADLVIGASPTQ